MADNNLLWQGIDYAANDPGILVEARFQRVQHHGLFTDQGLDRAPNLAVGHEAV